MPRWRSWPIFDGMILCCGEALIDMEPEGGLCRPSSGGSVFNTALALGRLGADAAFLWPLSEDRFGQQLQGLLAEAGVDVTLCPRIAQPTTLALVHMQAGQA